MEGVVVPINNGLLAIVDKEDAERVLRHSWQVTKQGRKFYASSMIDGKRVKLHHFVFGKPPEGHVVDHINGLSVDCRKANLRFATYTQNAQNSIVKHNSETGIKGVTQHKKTGRYNARIRVDGKRISLGYFDTAEEAGIAYATAAKQYFGVFANVTH